MEKYQEMTLILLREEAKKRGLKGSSAMKKQELIEALSALDKAAEKKAGKAAPKASEKDSEAEKPRVKKERKEIQNDGTKQEEPKADESKTLHKPTEKKTAVKETQTKSVRPAKKESPAESAKPEEKEIPAESVKPAKKESPAESAKPEEKESPAENVKPAPQETAKPQEANNNRPKYEQASSYRRTPSVPDTSRQRPTGTRESGSYDNRAQRNYVSDRQTSYGKPNYDRTQSQGQNRPVYQSRPVQPVQQSIAPTPIRRPETEETETTEYMTPPSRFDADKVSPSDIKQLDSGETREGILEIVSESFGFIRCDNYLPGDNDVYVSPAQIRRFGLKTGDIVCGNTKIRTASEKFSALLYINKVNGLTLEEISKRKRFEDLTPIFPNERIHLEMPGCSLSMRMVDLISPIGKGQRGMIVSPPKAGKTTLLKQIAKSITFNHPDMNLIILLIDERPEEVTDIKESISGTKVEVIYSTFDELPENHRRVSEMVIERAKRLVEQKQDVVILLDSITRLARAYNLTIPASGRTLSGGLDPAALHMPKKFFGAARNMREGGSLTVLATALVETGSRMDDVVFEEFKGTGNMELQLDRSLSERRVFPAIDLPKSSTRRDDLLLTREEQEATNVLRRMFNSNKPEDSIENIMKTFQSTKNNREFVDMIKKMHD